MLCYLTLVKYHDWERCLCAPLTQVGYLGSAVQQEKNIFSNNTEHKKAPSNAPKYDDQVRPNNIKLYYLTLLKYHGWERFLCAPLTQVLRFQQCNKRKKIFYNNTDLKNQLMTGPLSVHRYQE